jgi:hypothetical protein
MTEVSVKAKAIKKSSKKTVEPDDFRDWLLTLGLVFTPHLHVNGSSHSTAVVTVDFGTPLEETTKITAEQNAELMSRMKTLTRSMYKGEVNVRVQNDSSNGIWWTTIA